MTKIGCLLAVVLLLACGEERSAGGAGGETNTGISARIVGADGSPRAGVVARLRPSWYVREDSGSALEHLPVVAYADAVSDSRGRILFTLLRPGSYRLDLESGEEGLLQSVLWNAADTLVELGDLALQPLGRVQGDLPQHPGARVQLYGTERAVRADAAGRFSLERLPQGERWLRIADSSSATVLGEIVLPQHDSLVLVDDGQLGTVLNDFRSWKHAVAIPAAMFMRDSAFEAQPPWSLRAAPYLLKVDHRWVDFAQAAPDGRDLVVVNSEGNAVAFAIHTWNPLVQQGWLWVSSAEEGLRLYYGKQGFQNASLAADVWRNWTAQARDSLLTLNVDDFEDGDLDNALPDYLPRFRWFLGLDSLATGSLAVVADALSRSAYALQIRYTTAESAWVVAGIRVAEFPVDMTHLDSLVFWARGDGMVLAALENTRDDSVDKAWAPLALRAEWTRYCVRPADFAPPGPGGSAGWEAIRTAVNTISFFGMAGSEFWIDAVSLHGLHPLELRQ